MGRESSFRIVSEKTMGSFYTGIKSFFGPNKSLKFICDDDDIELVCCSAQLLAELNYLDPLTNFINGELQSFHENFGQGVATLAIMLWLFYKELLPFNGQECCAAVVVRELASLLEETCVFLERNSFNFLNLGKKLLDQPSFEDLLFSIQMKNRTDTNLKQDTSEKVCKNAVDEIKLCEKNLNSLALGRRERCFDSNSFLTNSKISVSKILRSSRNFADEATQLEAARSETLIVEQDEQKKKRPKHADYESMLTDLERMVSLLVHAGKEFAPLLARAWLNQLVYSSQRHKLRNDHRFNVKCLHTVPLIGNFSRSTVVSGLVVPVRKEMVPLPGKNLQRNSILVKGSIAFHSKHKGFKQSFKIQRSITDANTMRGLSEEQKWFNEVVSTLSKFNIRLLLVEKTVDPAIVDHCLANDIIVGENVPFDILHTLSKELETDILDTYVTNCDEENIASSLVSPWHLERNSLNFSKCDDRYIQIQLDKTFQTIVICSLTSTLAQVNEHKFWHLARRLESCSRLGGKMIRGGGHAEKMAFDWLEGLRPTSETNEMARTVLCNVLVGFVNLVEVDCKTNSALDAELGQNKQKTTERNKTDVVDDLNCKTEAWKCALHMAQRIVRTNYVVLVGNEPPSLISDPLVHDTIGDL